MTAARETETVAATVGAPGREHSVQFYGDDAALVGHVVEMAAAALDAGAAALLVATGPHRDAIASALRGRGFDVDALIARGAFIALDAAATLDAICVDGVPNAERFDAVVGETVRAAVERVPARRVRIFGEMVDLLWRRGDPGGPVRLEDLWHELLAHAPIDLTCAYGVDGFRTE